MPQSTQHREKLVGSRPRVDRAACAGCRSAPPQELHSLWWQSASAAQGRSAVHFVLGTLRRLGQRLEQRKPLMQVADGFHMG